MLFFTVNKTPIKRYKAYFGTKLPLVYDPTTPIESKEVTIVPV
jgi:hypothetical protein